MIRFGTTKKIKEYEGGLGPDRCVTRNLHHSQYGRRNSLVTDTTYFSTTEKYVPEAQRIENRKRRWQGLSSKESPNMISSERPSQHYIEDFNDTYHESNDTSRHWFKSEHEVKSKQLGGTLVTFNSPQDVDPCEEWFHPEFNPNVPTIRMKEEVMQPSRIQYIPKAKYVVHPSRIRDAPKRKGDALYPIEVPYTPKRMEEVRDPYGTPYDLKREEDIMQPYQMPYAATKEKNVWHPYETPYIHRRVNDDATFTEG